MCISAPSAYSRVFPTDREHDENGQNGQHARRPPGVCAMAQHSALPTNKSASAVFGIMGGWPGTTVVRTLVPVTHPSSPIAPSVAPPRHSPRPTRATRALVMMAFNLSGRLCKTAASTWSVRLSSSSESWI